MEKVLFKNRKGQNLAVVIEKIDRQKGLAFVAHGLGGFKEQTQIRTIAQTFLDNNYTVITFDTTNTFGESDGNYDDATITNYFEDLEDVITWAKNQNWYQEPFCLAGHSLGGITIALFAEKFPNLVKALAPLSTVISGKLSLETEKDYDEWRRVGFQEKVSSSKPGMKGRLKWSHMEDRLKYDLIPGANKLTMPVIMMVGSLDDRTLPQHQQLLYQALPGRKEIHIIEGAAHTFKDQEHLKQIYDQLDLWIKSL